MSTYVFCLSFFDSIPVISCLIRLRFQYPSHPTNRSQRAPNTGSTFGIPGRRLLQWLGDSLFTLFEAPSAGMTSPLEHYQIMYRDRRLKIWSAMEDSEPELLRLPAAREQDVSFGNAAPIAPSLSRGLQNPDYYSCFQSMSQPHSDHHRPSAQTSPPCRET